MAHLVIIDKDTSKQRYKVEYDVKTLDGKRKRRSKTFPAKTSMSTIKSFMREKETEYE